MLYSNKTKSAKGRFYRTVYVNKKRSIYFLFPCIKIDIKHEGELLWYLLSKPAIVCAGIKFYYI